MHLQSLLKFSQKSRCLNLFLSSRTSYSTIVHAERLKQRTFMRLTGKDTKEYLQSMMTNDIENIHNTSCIYSLLLNFKGRVLYDILLYKMKDNEYLIEHDATAKDYVQKHLTMYRLRKDVKIDLVNSLKAWVLFQPLNNDKKVNFTDLNVLSYVKDLKSYVTSAHDPRIPELGMRVVIDKDCNELDIFKTESVTVTENESYRLHRYKLGIGEGVSDHPPGVCLPFETNMDFINGVSFQKGCYIGQELTAKVHYTGVVRKRLMPIILDPQESYPSFPPECQVLNEKDQKMGKLRCHFGEHGLAVLNHEECAKAQTLHLKDYKISLKTHIPGWWPQFFSNVT